MKQIFIIEQRSNENETWYSVFGTETIINAERWIEELKEHYKQNPNYGHCPQFQVKKLNIF